MMNILAVEVEASITPTLITIFSIVIIGIVIFIVVNEVKKRKRNQ